jgi:hypothetical protein
MANVSWGNVKSFLLKAKSFLLRGGIFQALYLICAVKYVPVAKAFLKVFNEMGLVLRWDTAFITAPPGIYLYPFLVLCSFALFVWAYKNDRLGSAWVRILCNAPIPLSIYVFYIFLTGYTVINRSIQW